jgi:redox-sensitive transcriptional activator SoxR
VAQHLPLVVVDYAHTPDAVAQALAALPAGSNASMQDWQALSQQWRQSLDQRITELIQLRDQLSRCIGCGCLSLDGCPLRNPGDQLSAQGAGPHLMSLERIAELAPQEQQAANTFIDKT